MNFSISQPLTNPETLVLGLYNLDGATAICGSYINAYGDITKGAVEWFGHEKPARSLITVLADAKPIGALYLLVFCNHEKFVQSLVGPIKPIATSETERIKYRYFEYSESQKKSIVRTATADIPKANLLQMELLRALCGYLAWKVVYSENLPVSKAYYEQQTKTSGN